MAMFMIDGSSVASTDAIDIYVYRHGHHELCLRAIAPLLPSNMDIRTARRLLASDGGGSFPT